LEPDKCHFLQRQIEFLGHIVSDQGISIDPAKIDKVQNFPRPKDVTKIRSFLGLASYYRKFIKDFSQIARPLHQLTRKDEAFKWKSEYQHVFDILKERVTTSRCLHTLIFPKHFIC